MAEKGGLLPMMMMMMMMMMMNLHEMHTGRQFKEIKLNFTHTLLHLVV
jgi:hypothetical protein